MKHFDSVICNKGNDVGFGNCFFWVSHSRAQVVLGRHSIRRTTFLRAVVRLQKPRNWSSTTPFRHQSGIKTQHNYLICCLNTISLPTVADSVLGWRSPSNTTTARAYHRTITGINFHLQDRTAFTWSRPCTWILWVDQYRVVRQGTALTIIIHL